jgi:hypothetical protein
MHFWTFTQKQNYNNERYYNKQLFPPISKEWQHAIIGVDSMM